MRAATTPDTVSFRRSSIRTIGEKAARGTRAWAAAGGPALASWPNARCIIALVEEGQRLESASS